MLCPFGHLANNYFIAPNFTRTIHVHHLELGCHVTAELLWSARAIYNPQTASTWQTLGLEGTKENNASLITPCSKRKYTLCFPMSTQNVAGAGPPAVLRDSQSEFPNNQARVCEEIPNGSKVLRESSLGCCVRKFTKLCFCHWLLCYWLIKCIPSNFDLELWNHLEFFHKLSFVWCGTSQAISHTLSWVPHDVGYEYLLTETQSVYFLLELSVFVH